MQFSNYYKCKLFFICIISICYNIIEATPIVKYNNNNNDAIPNINDILAVAKSPFEPVTIAMSLPGARNDGLASEQPELTSTTKSETNSEQHKQTSRAVSSSFIEQQKDSSSSSSSTLTTPTDEKKESNDSTTTLAPESTDSSTDINESTESTDSAEKEKEKEKENSTTTTTTTTTTISPNKSSDSSSSTEVSETTSEASATTTTTAKSSEDNSATSTTSKDETTTESEDSKEVKTESSSDVTSTTTELSSTSTSDDSKVSDQGTPTTTEMPIKVPDSTEENSVEKTTTTESQPTTTITEVATTKSPVTVSTVIAEITEATTTTTTSEASSEQASSTSEPKVQDDSVINNSNDNKESTEDSSIATTTTPSPSTSTTTTEIPQTTTTSTQKPLLDEKDNGKSSSSCNHLPTYETDELQKVFREETTYKNGTIKGKFTYINYDQRYRLVHYTRLPYGPVKIDLVEELGKPDNSNNNSNNKTVGNDNIPNAVLQLRNILPNSLFGFPFLGPIQHQNQQLSSINNNNNNNNHNLNFPKDDKSNQYFYSTDSISTPNLLTPSVPVSLLPGQRRVSAYQQQQSANLNNNAPAADTLSQSYYENLPIPAIKGAEDSSDNNNNNKNSNKITTTSSVVEINEHNNNNNKHQANNINNNQFQYALVSQPEVAKQQQQQPSFVYTYVQPQAPHHYQYSPVPLFPTFSAQTSSSFYPTNVAIARQQQQLQQHQQQDTTSSSALPISHSLQAHQPHSHEHFVAPFMFTKPLTTSTLSQSSQQQPLNDEPNRLKLRVKTSKSLNHHQDSFGKSAQLKSPQQQEQSSASSTYLQSPVYSPIQILRYNHRHRSGKQQQFENTKQQLVNSSPIVYHVLRSPVGRIYTLPEYNQAHSIAYDHDTL